MTKPANSIPRWSLRVAVAAALLGGAAIGAVHLGLLAPLQAFVVFLAATVVGGAVAALLAIAGLIATRPGTGRVGRARAVAAAVLAAGMLAVVASASRSGGPHPVLNDVSTDLEDPPAFQALAEGGEQAGRDTGYPEAFRAPVRSAYPDVRTIRSTLAPAPAFAAALDAAARLGWQVVRRDAGDGIFEATDTSTWFRFVDDVVVRVRPDGTGARIDVRSRSRDGKDDFAVNANRIRAFARRLGAAS